MFAKDLESSSTVSSVISELMDYGLNERQARLYVSLIMNGPMKLSEVAYKNSLHLMQAYRTLKKLIELGLVESSFEKPAIFFAKKPKEGINLLLDDIQENFEKVALWLNSLSFLCLALIYVLVCC
ncbi:MAG: helix-turn-helix domain-containing protein [Nitrososphaerales archaeon]